MTSLRHLLVSAVAFSSLGMHIQGMDTQQVTPLSQKPVSEEMLPQDVWEHILSFLPEDNKFLHQWTRTHQVSQATIDRIINKYLKSHFVPQHEIPQAINNHFSAFHGTPEQKQEFNTKVKKAFACYTQRDSQRFSNFNDCLTGNSTILANTDIYSGAPAYGSCINLNYSDLVQQIKSLQVLGNLTSVKEALRKDLEFIRKSKSFAYTNSKKLKRYASVSSVVPNAATYIPQHINALARYRKPMLYATGLFVASSIIVRGLGYKNGMISLKSVFLTPDWTLYKYLSGNLQLAARINVSLQLAYIFCTSLIPTAVLTTVVGSNFYFNDLSPLMKAILDAFAGVEKEFVKIQRAIRDVEKGLV